VCSAKKKSSLKIAWSNITVVFDCLFSPGYDAIESGKNSLQESGWHGERDEENLRKRKLKMNQIQKKVT